MGLNIHRLLDPTGITGGGGSISNGFDPAGLFTKDAPGNSSSGGDGSSMDPSLEQQLMAYYNSQPAFSSEYNRLSSIPNGTGGRSAAEWMFDHIKSNPQDLNNFKSQVNGTPAGSTDGTTPTESVPLEQDLLDRAVTAGYDDWDNDAARKLKAQQMLAQYQGQFNQANKTLSDLYDGTTLNNTYNASTEATNSQQSALSDQLAARKAAFDKAMTDLYAAQDPLNAARIDNANTQATAVNLATQAQKDQVMADFARDGYIGGSTGTDSALTRASIDGRQRAAQVLGDAKTQNATDTAGIARYGATEGRSLSDYGSGEQRNIADSSAQRKLGFFTNDTAQRLANLSQPGNLLLSNFNTLNAADDYGQSGFTRFMKNLQYFRTSGTPAPTTQTYQQPTNDTGSAWQNLGAGLAGLGGSIGNANNWWKSPTSTTPYADTNAGMLNAGAPSAVASRYGL